MTIFWVKSSIILSKLAQNFFSPVQKRNNLQFCDIIGYKKRKVAVFGFGMDKNQDPGSGINISDPRHGVTVFLYLESSGDSSGAAHVRPHLVHLAGGLDGDPPRVKGHALPHQHHRFHILHQ
jgi:hypothetical protein